MYYMRDVLYFTILYNFRLYLGRNVPGRTIIPRRWYLGLIDKYFWGFRDSYLKPDTINGTESSIDDYNIIGEYKRESGKSNR